jgi:hypothetical protein
MNKTQLKQVTTILPFDAHYIKVGKGKKNIKWNLMDSNGKLISSNWFSSITKNTDGSVITTVTKRKKVSEATFLNVDSFAENAEFIKKIPIACFSLVDTGSLVSIKDSRYIARATVYGKMVYIDKNGEIWLPNGTKLRLLLNTVDSERLFAALRRFNKKMHYDTKPLEDGDRSTFESLRTNKIAAWAFYFATEGLSLETNYSNPQIRDDNTKKWTDDLIFRVREGDLPQSAIDALNAGLGEVKKAEPLNYKGYDVWLYTWHLKKEDLNKLIATLDSF